MALSNWDTLAIDPDGNPTKGEFQIGDYVVEIYKNWIYLKNSNLWKHLKNPSFTGGVLGQIESGNFYFDGFYIWATRGSQNSIQMIVKESTEGKIFAGVGCYGFEDLEKDYLESKGYVVPDDVFFFSTHLKNEDGSLSEYIGFYKNDEKILVKVDDGVDLHPFVGVKEKTLEELKNFITDSLDLNSGYASKKDKEWFESISWENLIRYNQGDAFFANHLSSEVIPGTEVGNPEPPIINTYL